MKYNPIPFQKIKNIELTTYKDKDYQKFMEKVKEKTPKNKKNRKRLIQQNYDKFSLFKEIYRNNDTKEEIMKFPEIKKKYRKLIKKKLKDRSVHGCPNSSRRSKKHRDHRKQRACWEGIDYGERKPPKRKINNPDITIQECKEKHHCNIYKDEAENRKTYINRKVKAAWLAAELPFKFCSKIERWEDDKPIFKNKQSHFHPARAKAFLRDMDIDADRVTTYGGKGRDKEKQFRKKLKKHKDIILSKKKIFKLEKYDESYLFKEPDFRIENLETFIEYKSNPYEINKQQLKDYQKLINKALPNYDLEVVTHEIRTKFNKDTYEREEEPITERDPFYLTKKEYLDKTNHYGGLTYE